MSLEDPTAELRALAHPLRLRMLSLLTGAAMTAAEVARELAITHANASYHLRQLHAAGLVAIAGEEHIRGGVAKRYRYDVDREPAALAGQDLRLVYATVAAELQRRAVLREPSPGGLTDAELWVEPAVWQAIKDRIGEASQDLHRAAQPPRTPGTMRVSATIALFVMANE